MGDYSENIYFSTGTSTSQEIVDSWMESAGHRNNILDPQATEMGAGVHYDGRGTHSVQRFK
ncbi:CAP domain-containing protein [Corynebacterium lowii]|nr:CAP domain-containing protein [Corynebacterium lowii]